MLGVYNGNSSVIMPSRTPKTNKPASESVAAAPVRATKPKTPKTISAVKVASTPRVRSVKHSKATPVAVSSVNAHEQIAKIAYGYWEARGFQHGSAEVDWLRAEQEYQLLTA